MRDDWNLIYEGYDPDDEKLREALTVTGNGYFATRGAFAQARADGVHYPGTYLAGGYNRLTTEIKDRGIENEDLVNLPNWLILDFRIEDGEWFAPAEADFLDYRLVLDIYEGVLKRTFRFEDGQGRRTRVHEERLVHMDNPHLAVIQMSVQPENWSGNLTVRSLVDAGVTNQGVPRYSDLRGDHLEVLETANVDETTCLAKVRTKQSRLEVALAARTLVRDAGGRLSEGVSGSDCLHDHTVGRELAMDVGPDAPAVVEKTVALFTSRDKAVSECALAAIKCVGRAGSFEEELACHGRVWRQLWHRFEVVFEQPEPDEGEHTEMVLRLYTFHLLQTTSVNTMDLDVGVPSRGWHGEAYRGHIFWDELFIFPTLNYRIPEITRSLLMYRYRRLGEARAMALDEGYKGAMYPWQSGSSGREESQRVHLNPRSGNWIPDNSRLQRHVNAAIAYNIVSYYRITSDMEFLSFYGAEMLLEIARLFSSMAEFDEDRDRYVIRGVMGPDEYHDSYPDSQRPGLNNNAYTNVMAAWVLRQARDILDILPEDRRDELLEKLGLDDVELGRWRDAAARLFVPFHDEGIISQFEGYEKLEEFDWQGYRERYDNIQRLDRILEAEEDTPNRYKASKQADVLMLFYLFSAEELEDLFDSMGYDFDPELIPKNIDYYLARTSHGSTLSSVVHSRVLARSDRKGSWKLFRQALRSDIEDIQGGTTPEGIHVGAMAGCVDIIQRGYTDMEPRDDVLHFNPCIPKELERLVIRLRYRSHSLKLTVTSTEMTVKALRTVEKPVKIGYGDKVFELCAGDARTIPLKQGARSLG